mmetsp:Transcript_7359/g.14752  ORF Transcript_7359/g.14752 Transcript_7359/m.14752 type:complete len:123 (-) Transcript_7359:51-419(-)
MSSSYGRQATHIESQILSREYQHTAQGRVAAEQDAGPSQIPHDGVYPSGIEGHAAGHDGHDRKRQRQDDDKGAQIVSRLKRVHLGNPNHHLDDETNTMYVVVNRMLKEAHEDMMRRKYESHS